MANLEVKDLGIINYDEAWKYQEEIFNQQLNNKTDNQILLFCEHPHVFTLGKSGVANNLLVNEDFLKKIDATFYKTDRGGDITYHGYGQIVGYPILNLDILKLGVKNYIYLLEQSIIDTLQYFDLNSGRLDNATGVWLDVENAKNHRKICAIGVKISHFVTMHGFALNVNTDLSYFNHINPCGFVDKGVTSMQKELGRKIELSEVKKIIVENFRKNLNLH